MKERKREKSVLFCFRNCVPLSDLLLLLPPQVDIIRPWQQVLESMDYVVAMVTRRGLMSLDGAVQDTEFLLSTWSTFRRWLKDEGLDTADGTVTFEALNKLEVIIVLLHKLNTKLKVFTGTAGNIYVTL